MPMDVFSLTSTTIPSTLTRRDTAADKPSLHLNLSKYSHFLRYPLTTTLTNNRIHSSNSIRAQVSGSTKASTAEGILEKTDSKDDNLVLSLVLLEKLVQEQSEELKKLKISTHRATETGNGMPFSETLVEVLYSINEQLQTDDIEAPLTKLRPVKKVALVVCTSGRDLCGGFNNAILKKLN